MGEFLNVTVDILIIVGSTVAVLLGLEWAQRGGQDQSFTNTLPDMVTEDLTTELEARYYKAIKEEYRGRHRRREGR